MKTVLILLCLPIYFPGYSQLNPGPVKMPIDSTSGHIQFQQVVFLEPDMNTEAIIWKAKVWVDITYPSTKNPIQQYNSKSGILVVKTQFPVTRTSYYLDQPTTETITVYHTVTIEAKPGRYRVTLSNYEMGVDGQRTILAANRGTMDREEYIAMVRKQARGTSTEQAFIKSVVKNPDSAITSERLFMADVKQQSLTLLKMLKRHML
ncbi:DUF4468 domain-containing protein [Spirosoma endbachense]|uniref:DUF4468 domain-containing protein n=1 Tax=Spirosoma endbachense TaxID=2666025 RepID=A0A6P1VUZ6_9BACT|nr:DUF4468 domain-containing protein [Spirosoma endbachense]QHV96545.1 DUF4468 domain-containing protein [Spirosoma endbachense]